MTEFNHETYLSPLTWRYGSSAMRTIWSEVEKRRQLRHFWVALAEAQQEAGLVSAEQRSQSDWFMQATPGPQTCGEAFTSQTLPLGHSWSRTQGVPASGAIMASASPLWGVGFSSSLFGGTAGPRYDIATQAAWLVFWIVAYALLGTFYLKVLPGWLGLPTQDVQFSTWEITKAVLIFLGIPLLAGWATRRWGLRVKGREWYDEKFVPFISPFALYGLLFTIVVMFALQGQAITADPIAVVTIAVPLLVYFAIMWTLAFAAGVRGRLGYPKTATLAFTAAGNNFELAIAVCIGVWGVTSGQALAGVIGPLIEVPALVALVYVSLWLRRRIRAFRGEVLPGAAA